MGRPRARAISRNPLLVPLSMLMLLMMIAALLGGCNTTAGVGEDMQSAGAAVERSADRNK